MMGNLGRGCNNRRFGWSGEEFSIPQNHGN
jgi:hypothetical protein